jgi:NAD(P)-dependent dehydrogenase (short-subunit alcohol dehydrogenase family)
MAGAPPTETSLLAGEIAFVTGGAQGIGLAIARRFAAQGARVMIADVRGDVAEEAAAAARADGLDVQATTVDVAEEASAERAVQACLAALGVPTAGVLNAAVLDLGPALEMSAERFRRVLEVNLTGAFLTARACARRMVAGGAGGTLTFTSSVAGLRGIARNSAYSASKFGLVGLAECLALELAPHGIRVNAVCPGQVETPMLHATARQKGTTLKALLAGVPLGRAASVEEVADAFVWLASPLARYVTGQAIGVDGGWGLAVP